MLFSFITGVSVFLAGYLWARLDLSFWMIPVIAAGSWLALLLAAFLVLLISCAVVDEIGRASCRERVCLSV